MTVLFELDGQEFLALNGGPHFKFSPAISFIANCKNQQEIDELWQKLSAGGEPSQCGWLTDKFGVSWQIVPANIGQINSRARHRLPKQNGAKFGQGKGVTLRKSTPPAGRAEPGRRQ